MWLKIDERRTNMHTCPICNRKYSAPPAMSRRDGSDICPVCGAREGLEDAGIRGEQAEEILKSIEKGEIECGRVEPLES